MTKSRLLLALALLCVLAFKISTNSVIQTERQSPAGAPNQQGNPSRAQRKKSEQERHRQESEVQTPAKPATLLLSRAWSFLTSEIPRNVEMTVDQGRVYFPLASGALLAVDLRTGGEIWSIEAGPTQFSPIASAGLVLLALTTEGGSRSGTASQTIRAFHSHDGSAAWTVPLESPARVFHFSTGLRLALAGLTNGSLVGISPSDGAISWSISLPSPPTGEPMADGQNLFVATEDGDLCVLDQMSSAPRLLRRTRLDSRITSRPAVTEKDIFVATTGGYLYRLDRERLTIHWKRRTGAAIASAVVLFEKNVVVGSFDNFVYCFGQTSGLPRWRRATDGRIQANMLRMGRTLLIAPLRAARIFAISLENGTLLDTFNLNPDAGVAGPLSGDASTLIIPADEGVFALNLSTASGSP